MSRHHDYWYNRDNARRRRNDRRRRLATDPQRRDVLVAAWRSDDGVLHSIPSLSCDLRTSDELVRWTAFDKFIDEAVAIAKRLACAVEITRLRGGSEAMVMVIQADGEKTHWSNPGWRSVVSRAYDWGLE